MGLRITEFEPTPNPNALKCHLDGPVSDRSMPFRSGDDAAGHPLASAILAIPGVTGLLLCGTWLTINRAADQQWPPIKRALGRALDAHT